MNRFVSTFESNIDARGRVSVPAPFRAVLERDAASFGDIGGIYCYPSLDAPAIDAGSERLARKIDGLLGDLPEYSDERDQLSVALYGNVQILSVDGDGRIVLPQELREHAGIARRVTFVGLGDKFQIWAPAAFAERDKLAREKARAHRSLFDAGRRLARSEPGAHGADRPGGSASGALDDEEGTRK